MTDDAECGQSPEDRALSQRALRALAIAQLRQAQYQIARSNLLRAMERSEELQFDQIVLTRQLRETISAVAREELAAGHSPVAMVALLHEIVREALLDREIRQQIEPDVVQCGIEAYFAA